MLTPQEITDKAFDKAVFGGYDTGGVDDFLEALSADYSALYKENAILKGKLKVLVEKVEEYRSTEDAMRMALLNAQKMGEEITNEAAKQKEQMLKSVDEQAKLRLEEVARLVSDEEAKLQIASKETAKFIQLSQAVIQKHSEFLVKLETARRMIVPEPVPAPPTHKEQINEVAGQIDSAVGKITSDPSPDVVSEPEQAYDEAPADLYDDEGEPTKVFGQESNASTSPRPKFDFDDLKFGANFDKK